MGPQVTELLTRLQRALADGYVVERAVGKGGMATVFLAQDRKLRRAVAIKVLRPELATAIGVERFLREIETAAGLAHPLIVPLFASGEENGLLYYVMQYVEGEETLRKRLTRERQLPIDEAVRISCDVAAALAYAHSRGVVHRDIKPENIMFSAGRAVVADFGIARALSAASRGPLTDTGLVVGTPTYMSPEQATGKGPIDGRSDLYSLGCVLYEMLAGTPPFDGPTVQALIARHCGDPVPPIRGVRPAVPDAVERAMLRALAKVPADRFGTALQFAEALLAPTSSHDGGEEADSIAVLPFANLSPDPNTEYFSDGITEEIINALAHLPGLRVAAPTSSFAFRGRTIELGEVGAKLRVATVLQGSVRTVGNRLRVTAQLIKVADGFTLWSERYDREMTDVFAIQDEIAKAIAARLQVTLDASEGRALVTPATANLDAYHLHLKGRYYWAQRGLGLKKALDCFGQALALDPNYALAHAGFADACTLLATYGFTPASAILPKAHAAIDRALDLAPELAEAHCASGTLELVLDRNWAAAAQGLRRAIQLNPRYVAARYWFALYLSLVEGQFEEALAHARRAVELDPLAALPLAQLGMVLVGAGRHEEALAPLRRSTELAPAMLLPRLYLGVTCNHLGHAAEAIASLELAAAVSGRHPWSLAFLAVSVGSQGRSADAEALHDELAARARREYVQASMLALATAAAGRVDEAFALLNRACDDRDGILMFSKRFPAFALLQKDPRMAEIYRRIGFPETA